MKRQARIDATVRAGTSFASIAGELIDKKACEGLGEATLKKQRWLLKLLSPELGRRPIAEITLQELLHELKKHERRGRLETAKQLRSFASRVFRFGAATARAENDPALLLLSALTSPPVKHFAAIIAISHPTPYVSVSPIG